MSDDAKQRGIRTAVLLFVWLAVPLVYVAALDRTDGVAFAPCVFWLMFAPLGFSWVVRD